MFQVFESQNRIFISNFLRSERRDSGSEPSSNITEVGRLDWSINDEIKIGSRVEVKV